jgi:phage terminase large subunit GpA-like protein
MGKLDQFFRFEPVVRMRLPEWADTYRTLPSSTSAVPGRWRTSKVEWARGPMMATGEAGVKTLTVCCATQMGKSEIILNLMGSIAHLAPAPILFCAPSEKATENFSRERLQQMIAATPVLRERFNWRETASEDKLNFKGFPGGFIALESAGSPTNLSMRPIRITVADEIDKYTVTKEGDPLSLLEERTSTYAHNALRVRCCSPTLATDSRIWKSYQQSDQRRAFITCSHCQEQITLSFFKHKQAPERSRHGYVEWGKSESGEHFPLTAEIICRMCGSAITEDQRRAAITSRGGIRWYQTKPFECCETYQEPVQTGKWEWDAENLIGYACCTECGKRALPNTHAGYHASKMLDPFVTVAGLAVKWIEDKDDVDKKLTFYNTQCGEAFEEDNKTEAVAPHVLSTRAEEYAAQVPAGVVAMFLGADVHPGGTINEGRIESEVIGLGLGEECWSIDYQIFPGDISKPDVWQRFDQYLLTTMRHEIYGAFPIYAAAIDSGTASSEVYNYVAKRNKNVWAIKGASDARGQWAPIALPLRDRQKTWRPSGPRPEIIGVNAAKDYLRRRLWIEEPGPGYQHFPIGRPEAYYQQLTSEDLFEERKHGVVLRRFKPRGRLANEALDTRIYALAAYFLKKELHGFDLEKAHRKMQRLLQRKEEPRQNPPRQSRQPDWITNPRGFS